MKRKLFTFLVLLVAGMSGAFSQRPFYHFYVTIPSGDTLYFRYNALDSTKVALCPPDINGWDFFTQPSGDLVIPDTVTHNDTTFTVNSFYESAFVNCMDLTSVHIPDSVIWISNSCFSNCYSLTSVNIPDRVDYIGNYSFYNCHSLDSINIPENVYCIGAMAFLRCSRLRSIHLPERVQVIYDYAFSGCTNLATINIPSKVTSIESGTFTNCRSLTEITIPSGVTRIGSSAFDGCTSLTQITCKAFTAPTINGNTFEGVSDSIPIYIPCGSTASYVEKWTNFYNFIELDMVDTIAVSVNDSTMGTAIVIQQPTCDNGRQAVIEAIPNEGFRFRCWSDYSTDRLRTLAVTVNTMLTAYFDTLYEGISTCQPAASPVAVYPNPATDVLHVDGEGVGEVSLYDMSGRCAVPPTDTRTLHLAALPQGVYYLKVRTREGVSVQKVVKQ